MTKKQTLGVHPVAGLFPMLADDELRELADDIKQRGLLQPIVLDSEGRVLDGRNRLAACELAGVEPTFETYAGGDPDGYALSTNINRRHLTQGQKAMLIVEGKGEAFLEEIGRSDDLKISNSSVSKARLIKAYAPALVAPVISGADQLNRAYDFARQEKTRSEGADAQLAKLRTEDPELAAKVIEGELSLPGAQAELKARQARRESDRRVAITNLKSVLIYLVSASITPGELAERDYANAVDEFKQDDLNFAAATMAAICALKES